MSLLIWMFYEKTLPRSFVFYFNLNCMKKSVSAVISMMAVVILTTGCGNSAKNKEKVINTIGNFSVVERSVDGFTGVALIDSVGADVTYGVYKAITDEGKFIKAVTSEDRVEVYRFNGHHACSGDSVEVKNFYAAGETPSGRQFLKLFFGERVNAFYLEDMKSILTIESSREEVYPLDNGYVIYMHDKRYGFAKEQEQEPVIENICNEITVICLNDKVVYLIKSDDFTGYVDNEGNGIKRLSRAQYKKALNTGKLLWKDGKVSARLVKKI